MKQQRRMGVTRAVLRRIWLARRADPRTRVPEGARAPILLVHGFAGSTLVMRPLGSFLERRLERPVVHVALGSGLRDIRSSAQTIHAMLADLSRAPEFSFADIVAHSLGGLAATYLLKCSDRGRRVGRVVTLGTPHRGTPVAWFGVAGLGGMSRAMWQMRPHAPFLHWLEKLPVPERCELVSVFGLRDTIVPPRFAMLRRRPGQRSKAVLGADHFDLLSKGAVFRRVESSLEPQRRIQRIRDSGEGELRRAS